MSQTIQLENQYCAQNYAPLPVVIARGRGVYVWDDNGKQYIDMMSAYSAVSHGHCHPRIVKAMKEQLDKIGVISRAFHAENLGRFLEKACGMTGFEKALPMNTGAEAVETAMKAARKWGYQTKGIPENKAEIIACEGNFHGRTISIVGLSSETQYQEGFGPFPSGLKQVPYGDIDALEKAITANTAAFLVEPIQGEGGIIIPPEGYLQACAELCKKHNVLLICDEVQSGLGRTGKLMAYEHEGIKPDGLILGKALGGGVLPISLFLANSPVMDVFTPGDHGSTFGGYPLAAAVGYEALCILEEDQLALQSKDLGDYFMEELNKIESPLIKEIRGRGLFIGIEVDDEKTSARHFCEVMMEKGLLSKDTHHTVARLAPPLVINRAQINKSLDIIRESLQEIEQSLNAKPRKQG